MAHADQNHSSQQSLQTLMSDDYKKLLATFDTLKKHGVNVPVLPPKILIPKTEDSSPGFILNRITGLCFVKDEKSLGFSSAIEISFRKAESTSMSISIVAGAWHSFTDQDRKKRLTLPISSLDLLSEAFGQGLRNMKDSQIWSFGTLPSDIVRFDISGPGYADLDIDDMTFNSTCFLPDRLDLHNCDRVGPVLVTVSDALGTPKFVGESVLNRLREEIPALLPELRACVSKNEMLDNLGMTKSTFVEQGNFIFRISQLVYDQLRDDIRDLDHCLKAQDKVSPGKTFGSVMVMHIDTFSKKINLPTEGELYQQNIDSAFRMLVEAEEVSSAEPLGFEVFRKLFLSYSKHLRSLTKSLVDDCWAAHRQLLTKTLRAFAEEGLIKKWEDLWLSSILEMRSQELLLQVSELLDSFEQAPLNLRSTFRSTARIITARRTKDDILRRFFEKHQGLFGPTYHNLLNFVQKYDPSAEECSRGAARDAYTTMRACYQTALKGLQEELVEIATHGVAEAFLEIFSPVIISTIPEGITRVIIQESEEAKTRRQEVKKTVQELKKIQAELKWQASYVVPGLSRDFVDYANLPAADNHEVHHASPKASQAATKSQLFGGFHDSQHVVASSLGRDIIMMRPLRDESGSKDDPAVKKPAHQSLLGSNEVKGTSVLDQVPKSGLTLVGSSEGDGPRVFDASGKPKNTSATPPKSDNKLLSQNQPGVGFFHNPRSGAIPETSVFGSFATAPASTGSTFGAVSSTTNDAPQPSGGLLGSLSSASTVPSLSQTSSLFSKATQTNTAAAPFGPPNSTSNVNSELAAHEDLHQGSTEKDHPNGCLWNSSKVTHLDKGKEFYKVSAN